MANDARKPFRETVYSLGSNDRVFLESDTFNYLDGTGDSEPIINLSVDVGSEMLTVTLDAYHLRELRLAVQRAERWLKG